MAFRIATLVRNSACDAIADYVDSGGAAGTIKILTGAQPAATSDSASGTTLADLTFATTAFGAAAAGVATANSITSDTNVAATGTAGWARILTSTGGTIADMSITSTTGTGDLKFDNVSFVATGTAAISSMTITVPISSTT